jgi:enoyl-CoA hydratase/carnithine racemase
MTSTVICEKKDGVAHLVLNRPQAGNAINEQLAQELAAICQQINQDEQVVVVVISGAGPSFCIGSDLEPARALSLITPAQAVASVDRPVIAAINGEALGTGLELALSCDLRIASDKACFGLTQLSQGFIPWDGGSQRLPRIVGRARALELLLTSSTIDAVEALRIGLANKVVPADSLLSEAQALASQLAAKGPIALRYAKEAVNKGLDLTLEQGLRLEADLYFLLHTTADRTEGVRAFLEKRPPRFKGA